MTRMTGEHDQAPSAPETGDDLRRRTKSGNRNVAALLAGISLLFLAGALGVGALVLYGPV